MKTPTHMQSAMHLPDIDWEGAKAFPLEDSFPCASCGQPCGVGRKVRGEKDVWVWRALCSDDCVRAYPVVEALKLLHSRSVVFYLDHRGSLPIDLDISL